jgi:hypothetical protein
VIANYGGQGRNRTADASLFRAALYQLSYLATERVSLVKGCCGKEDYNNAEGPAPTPLRKGAVSYLQNQNDGRQTSRNNRH